MGVSIIIPIYNVASYVEACIRSVIQQTYSGSMECLIIDDGGTDGSMKIVAQMISEYTGPIEFKVIHHTKNRGLSAARNSGTLQATGNYLFYLDGDDEISENCIELMMHRVKENPSLEMVQGNTSRWFTNKKSYTQIKKVYYPLVITNQEARRCFYHNGQMMVEVWNKLVRRDFVLNNKLLCREGIISEDFL